MRIQGHDTARWLDGERLVAYPRFVLAIALVLGAVWLVLGGGSSLPGGLPLGREFLSLWAAGSLALKGAAQSAYDAAQIRAVLEPVIGSAAGGYAAWYAPPPLMLFGAPAAMLPFHAGLVLWTAVTFGFYFLMVRAIGREAPVIWPLVAFPAVYAGFALGDNGFLAAAILGGVLLLADRRPLAAGILAGALIFKPFIAVALALVFAAGGRWRALGPMIASAVALGGLTMHLLGPGVWQTFIAVGPMSGWALAGSGVPLCHMNSLFAGLRGLGAGPDAALAVHGLVGVAAMASAMWAWRQPVSLEIRGSILVCAMLLAHPFVRSHDLVLLAIPIGLFLTQGRRDGFHAWEGPVLVAMWWLPAVAVAALPVAGPFAAPVVIMLFLALVLRRIAETAIHGARMTSALAHGGRP